MAGTFWKARSVLVTGGAGFIGYAIATHLAKLGARVVVLDIKPTLPNFSLGEYDARRKIRYICGSVTSKRTIETILRKHNVKTIFHLAAEAIVGEANRNPVKTFASNAQGTWTLLEVARKCGKVSEIVVASSDKAYGSHEHLPYNEEAALRGLNPYDCSKSCTDLIAQMYAHAFGLPIAILRCGNVYGPGDTNWSRLIPDVFRSAAKNKVLQIRSDGNFRRDYVYIDDIVGAYLLIAKKIASKKLSGEAFNIGNNKPLKVLDVVNSIQRIESKLRYHILNDAKNEIRDQYLDSKKAIRILKWKPRVTIGDGLELTGDWYKEYFQRT